MKIERTPDLLVIDNRPIFLAVMLSIMLLGFMAGGIQMLTEGLTGRVCCSFWGCRFSSACSSPSLSGGTSWS